MGKYFKIITTALFTFCFVMAFSGVTASAAEKQPSPTDSNVLVEEGYTEDGIRYEVYDVYKSTITKNDTGISTKSIITVFVERKVTYHAVLEAWELPSSLSWSEQLDSYTVLRGTLYLTGFTIDYDNKITTGFYEGTLIGNI